MFLFDGCWWPVGGPTPVPSRQMAAKIPAADGASLVLLAGSTRGVSDTVGHRSGVTLFHLGTGCPGSQLEAQSVCGPRAPPPLWKKKGNCVKKIENWGQKNPTTQVRTGEMTALFQQLLDTLAFQMCFPSLNSLCSTASGVSDLSIAGDRSLLSSSSSTSPSACGAGQSSVPGCITARGQPQLFSLPRID